jgi:hypothetical protein
MPTSAGMCRPRELSNEMHFNFSQNMIFQVFLNYSETAAVSMYTLEFCYKLGRLLSSKWNTTMSIDKISYDTKITIYSDMQIIELEVGKFYL